MKNNLEYFTFIIVGGTVGLAIRLVFFFTYQHGVGGAPGLSLLLSFLAGCVVFGIIGVMD